MASRKEVELAWAAGFFDGEGCTSYHRRLTGRGAQLRMAINQMKRLPLVRFKKAVGAGAIYPCRTQGGYMWSTGDYQTILRIFNLLLPYLCNIKIRQARQKIALMRRV